MAATQDYSQGLPLFLTECRLRLSRFYPIRHFNQHTSKFHQPRSSQRLEAAVWHHQIGSLVSRSKPTAQQQQARPKQTTIYPPPKPERRSGFHFNRPQFNESAAIVESLNNVYNESTEL